MLYQGAVCHSKDPPVSKVFVSKKRCKPISTIPFRDPPIRVVRIIGITVVDLVAGGGPGVAWNL